MDIYGFETFEWNSFEQFCINYANEKLQQQFNQHVFKLEQEEYVREELNWTFIDYYDNQPCIDLIEKPLGIFDLLDEECRIPRGTDSGWCSKLYDKCKKYPNFAKPKIANTAFIIIHFADKVQYQSEGFVEKNRDTVMEEQVGVLRSSSNALVCQLVQKKEEPAGGAGKKANSKKTVGSQFRESLVMLVETLNSTTPHYIRCIKPNDQKARYSLDNARAMQQLRACGVLETVKVSALGFPSRQGYDEFAVRYRVLFKNPNYTKDEVRDRCREVLSEVLSDDDKYKFGLTKIFFRAGTVAFIEKRRADKLLAAGIVVQTIIRGWHFRKEYIRLRELVVIGQCLARGRLGRMALQGLRENRASLLIQKAVRGFFYRSNLLMIKQSVEICQKCGLGYMARTRYAKMLGDAKLIMVQRMARGYLVRKHFQKYRQSAMILQNSWKRWLATKEFDKLRMEARNMDKIKTLNKGLENKIVSMQQRLDEANAELTKLREVQKQFEQLTVQFQFTTDQLKQVEQVASKVSGLESQIADLTSKLAVVESQKKELNQLLEEKENAMAQLKGKVDKMEYEMKTNQGVSKSKLVEVQQKAQRKLDHERSLILLEVEQERAAYQKLLLSFRDMEDELENLRNGGRDDMDPEAVEHL